MTAVLPADGQAVDLDGVLGYIETHRNRTDAPWATADLQTGGHVVVVTVHPQLHQQVADLLVTGNRVRVTGRVDDRGDQAPTVIALSVERAA